MRMRRSARAQRLRLVVRADGVECVLPLVCPERLAHDFIRRHRDWLTRKYAEAVVAAPARSFWAEACDLGELSFPLHGEPKPFQMQRGASGSSRLSFDGLAFQVHGCSAPAELERLVLHWASASLSATIAPMLNNHADRLAVEPRQIRIKRMRTRWGSCGAANDINLNWVLIAAPLTVLDYVIVHELCHIRQRDHSPRFWQLVATRCPDFRQARAWLKAEGGRLLQRFASVQ